MRPLVTDLGPSATRAPQAQQAGLTAQFFGTTTLAFSDGTTTIVTDGFFSRPSIRELASGPVKPNLHRIEAALASAHLGHVAAILVAHSHHDHAMDSPYVAHLTGATLVGSRSSANIARGVDFPESKIAEVIDGSTCHFGAFTVSVFQTPHSKPNLIAGRIERALGRSAWVGAYKDGGNFSFHIAHPWGNVLVVPSRGVRKNWRIPLQSDVVFLGIGGSVRSAKKMQPLWDQFVTASAATKVYPIHWDNFFAPSHPRSADGTTAGIGRKLAKLRSLAQQGQHVALLQPFEKVLLRAPGLPLTNSEIASKDGCDLPSTPAAMATAHSNEA